MRTRIRTKLFLSWLVPILAALLAADLYLAGVLDRLLTEQIRDDLVARLRLCARDAAGDDDWAALAHELGRSAGARLTLVAADGVVRGDSELGPDELARLENHRDRPEIAAALAVGQGTTIRHSTTLGERMLYVALPIRRAGTTVGVGRLAVPLTAVDRAIRRVRGALLTAAVIALVAAMLLSLGVSHWVSRGLRRLTDVARRMAAGDLGARTATTGSDEVAELGHALADLAAALTRSLADLRGQRDLMHGILTGMQEGVLLLDAAGRIALVNPALREMLLVGAEVVGRPLLDGIRLSSLKELLDGVRAGGATSGEVELLGVRPRRLLVHAATLAEPSPGLVAVFVDVTEMRRLETLRRDFVANASHELRTPIATVRSAAETLRLAAATDPDAAARFVEIIERNAERLQRLVEDLLDLSRIESREYRLALEPVDVPEAAARVLALFGDAAARKRQRLTVEVGELPPVLADRRALEQVLANLVDNAVKYCPDGAAITLRAAAVHGQVRIEVVDDGPGIDERHLPRLFERFYRVDTGRSRELGGTGLGLSIVKHLVEAMHGSVDVVSAPGQGARFSVTLDRSAR